MRHNGELVLNIHSLFRMQNAQQHRCTAECTLAVRVRDDLRVNFQFGEHKSAEPTRIPVKANDKNAVNITLDNT